jgi:hypothetical protein
LNHFKLLRQCHKIGGNRWLPLRAAPLPKIQRQNRQLRSPNAVARGVRFAFLHAPRWRALAA